MGDQIINTQSIPELSKRARRALIECGLWLRIGFIGASTLAAGLLQLFSGEVKALSALALAVGGGVLAAGSWWRGRTVLDLADRASAVIAGAPSPASARAAAGT